MKDCGLQENKKKQNLCQSSIEAFKIHDMIKERFKKEAFHGDDNG
jgi:hypothetical protein